MKHPRSRAERRSVRLGWIARRRYVAEHVWFRFNPPIYEHNRPWYRPCEWEPFQWGRYAKWNMNCGCKQCHSEKYFKEKRKRRRALDFEVILNIQSWAD